MLAVCVLPPAGGGTLSCVVPYHGGGVGRGARLLPPPSRICRLGHHLRRRLCAVHLFLIALEQSSDVEVTCSAEYPEGLRSEDEGHGRLHPQ